MPVTGPVIPPQQAWSAWGGEPALVALVILAAWAHLRGTHAIWRQVGRGRVVRSWQVAVWYAGLTAVLVAFVSPLDALAGTLFSAHMAQHTVLTVVAAPLLALSAPGLALVRGLPAAVRDRLRGVARPAAAFRRAERGALLPLLAVVPHFAVVWLWHLPALYQLALRNPAVHVLEHVTLLATAYLLWRAVVVSGRRHAFGYGAGLAVVFAAALMHGGVGAVLTFADQPLYPAYTAGAAAWGLDPLADQRLAGVLMWGPAKLVHAVAGVALVLAWLRSVDERGRRREELAGVARP